MGHYTDEREGPVMKKNLSAAQKHRRKVKALALMYDVGYGKPPKEHRFKKGQSGNPKGRPPIDREGDLRGQAHLGRPISLVVDLPGYLAKDVSDLADHATAEMRKRPCWENMRRFTLQETLVAAATEFFKARKELQERAAKVPLSMRGA